MIHLTFPFLPPSANDLVTPLLMNLAELKADTTGEVKPQLRLVKTATDKRFRARLQLEAEDQLEGVQLLAAAVEVRVVSWFPTIASDIGNRMKSVLDALKGLTWFDDKQITLLTERKRLAPDGIGRMEMLIMPATLDVDDEELARRLAESHRKREQREAYEKQETLFDVTPKQKNPAGESVDARIRRLATPNVVRPR